MSGDAIFQMGLKNGSHIIRCFAAKPHMSVAPKPDIRLHSCILVPNVDSSYKSFLSVDDDDLAMIPVCQVG